MNTRTMAAALIVALASVGVAHAQVAPSYNADGNCAVYALSVDPRFCEGDVDPIATGSVGEDDAPMVIAPNAAGEFMPWVEGRDGFPVEYIRPLAQ